MGGGNRPKKSGPRKYGQQASSGEGGEAGGIVISVETDSGAGVGMTFSCSTLFGGGVLGAHGGGADAEGLDVRGARNGFIGGGGRGAIGDAMGGVSAGEGSFCGRGRGVDVN